jgi:large subunit ribosomal protein LP0
MVKEDRSAWKANYFVRVVRLFDDYPKCFVVGIDNVRSNQMQQIRKSLRGQAELLMGKKYNDEESYQGTCPKEPTSRKGDVAP